jgi:DNA-binding MarR family transcriptional regulator
MGLNYLEVMKKAERRASPGLSPKKLADLLAELVCTETSLRRAARRLGRLYDEAVAPAGINATQVSLLAQIAGDRRTEGPTLQDLAERLAIQISALTHALRPLVRDGLVEVHRDADDKRIKHGVLTPSGRTRLQDALQLWAAANRRVEGVLGSALAEDLRGLADQVASPEFLDAYAARKTLLSDTKASSER